jgi:hypothetical protein
MQSCLFLFHLGLELSDLLCLFLDLLALKLVLLLELFHLLER